jgi:hypothetical protein
VKRVQRQGSLSESRDNANAELATSKGLMQAITVVCLLLMNLSTSNAFAMGGTAHEPTTTNIGNYYVSVNKKNSIADTCIDSQKNSPSCLKRTNPIAEPEVDAMG